MGDALAKFFAAFTFFVISVAMPDWRWRVGVLFVGLFVWTVFVQDHMTWKRRTK